MTTSSTDPAAGCAPYREAVSALLDDEEPGLPRPELDAHLVACAACRDHAALLGRTHRALRVRDAVPVPDLTEAVLARVGPRRTAPLAVVRWALLTTGALLVVLGLAGLVDGAPGELTHTHRELGAWYTAFGAALLVVAHQPDRARGLLPFAALLGIGLAGTALADVASGRSTAVEEASHALELLGVALVAAAARVAPPVPVARRVLA
jgi:predicted anti-sigma-YlaC factor YlaD